VSKVGVVVAVDPYRPPVAAHTPLWVPVNRSATLSLKVSVVSRVSCGGSTRRAKLSHTPRELSEPAPTKPRFRPTYSPSSNRFGKV
jgi:hypothetical protein